MKKVMLMLSVMICALVALFPALKVSADEAEETRESKAVSAEETAAENTQAAETAEKKTMDVTSVKAIVAGAVIAAAAVAGALGMAFSIGKAVESTARQPEAGADIRSTMMLGLVFIETAIIYALIVAILVVFVL